jgi:hypothetical protein
VRTPLYSEEGLREAAAIRVKVTSLQAAALEVGLSEGTLEEFLSGASPSPSTLGTLREWFNNKPYYGGGE